MAKAIYDTQDIALQDETEVTLKPLPIGKLRKFMAAWRGVQNLEGDDALFDVYINVCGIALSNELADKFEKPLDVDKVLSDDYREYLEDVLDIDTIFKIIEVCGGINLNDPKLVEAAEAAALAAAGTN